MGTTPMHRASNWRRIFVVNRATATAEQKAALARVLASRYRRLRAGELYRIDGWPLQEPTEAITVDTGLLLIGLFECLKHRDEAEKTLREIVVLFLRSLDLSDDARRSIDPNRLELRKQFEMLNLWTRQRGRSPMTTVLSAAAAWLFRDQVGVDWGSGRTSRQIARALFPDAWALYSKTLNLFGRSLAEARVLHSAEFTNEPTSRSSMRAA